MNNEYGNYVIYAVCLAFAFVLLVAAIGLFIYPTYKAFKGKKVGFDFLKKYKYYFLSSFLSLLVSFILFDIQFYMNPENAEYISVTLLTSVDSLHYLLIFGGSILTAITLFSLILYFCYYFFFSFQEDAKLRKKVFWQMAGIFVLFIVAFLIFSEGNAPYLRYPLLNRLYIGSSGIRLVTAYTGFDWAPIPSTDAWGFEIAFYALCILFGAICAYAISDYLLRVKYGERGLLSTVFLIGLPTGIVGCRLWYVIGNWTRDGFDKDFWKIFRITDGGLAIMGASLAVIVCLIYLLVIKYINHKTPYTRINYLLLLDLVIPTILLAQGLGRWGNFFNNEVHGVAITDNISNWMWLPTVIRNNMHFSSAHRVFNQSAALALLLNNTIYPPLFYIESFINYAGFAVLEFGVCRGLRKLWVKKDGSKKWYNKTVEAITPEGCNLGYYLAWYGTTRAILEPLRDSSFNMGNDDMWSVYSAYFMIGIGLLIVILLAIWQFMRDNGKLIPRIKEEKKV